MLLYPIQTQSGNDLSSRENPNNIQFIQNVINNIECVKMTETHPLISVIIPLFNKAKWISRAIDSVLSQTIQNYEVIVVGGKSVDGGEDVVKMYDDPRIRLIVEIGSGVSAARNQGVSVARSDLIAFLDADDAWSPEYLETILRLREKYPEAGIYSTGRYDHYPSSDMHCSQRRYWGIDTDWEGIIPSVFECAAKSGCWIGFASAISIPKKIFIEMGGFNERYLYAEDEDLWGRISLFYPNAHCGVPLLHYYHDSASASANISVFPKEMYPFDISVTNLISCGALDNYNDWDALKLYLLESKIKVVANNLLSGDLLVAFLKFVDVMRYDLSPIKWVACVLALRKLVCVR